MLNWSKALSELIQFTNHHVLVEVTGNKVSRGFGFELEMKVNYFFYGDARVITWMKNAWKN